MSHIVLYGSFNRGIYLKEISKWQYVEQLLHLKIYVKNNELKYLRKVAGSTDFPWAIIIVSLTGAGKLLENLIQNNRKEFKIGLIIFLMLKYSRNFRKCIHLTCLIATEFFVQSDGKVICRTWEIISFASQNGLL